MGVTADGRRARWDWRLCVRWVGGLGAVVWFGCVACARGMGQTDQHSSESQVGSIGLCAFTNMCRTYHRTRLATDRSPDAPCAIRHAVQAMREGGGMRRTRADWRRWNANPANPERPTVRPRVRARVRACAVY